MKKTLMMIATVLAVTVQLTGCMGQETDDENKDANEPVAVAQEEINGNYADIWVPSYVNGTGGVYPSSIYRDSAASSWKCNGGSWEYPADWILQFHLSGAYSSRANLKIRGITSEGLCYIQANNAGRVFTDDDVQVCVGYVTWYRCSNWNPTTGDAKLFIQ